MKGKTAPKLLRMGVDAEIYEADAEHTANAELQCKHIHIKHNTTRNTVATVEKQLRQQPR